MRTWPVNLIQHAILGMYLLTLLACNSTPKQEEPEPPVKRLVREYHSLDWQRRVAIFEEWDSKRPTEPEERQLFKYGLEDEHPAVLIACLERSGKLGYDEYRRYVITLLQHPDSMVRWHAVLALEQFSVEETDLTSISRRITDTEWLVREAAFRSIRRYSAERKNKTLFFPIIFRLEEQNAAVLKEIYRTLIWYDDERAFPYMLKRTYLARSGYELITTLQELKVLNRPEVTARIRAVARTHSRPDIRQAAADLLKK